MKQVTIHGEQLVPSLSFFVGVFLLSSAVLSFEILASRVSSVVFIYNYAFMIVSLAILGLGCGGIFVFYRWRHRELGEHSRKFSFYCSLFAASVSLFIILITETNLFINKFLYFLILFIPFFFAGVVLSLAFRSFAQESFKLYASDLLGAASGSILSIWTLNTLGGVNGILLIGILGSIASFLFAGGYRKKFLSLKIPVLLSSLCFIIFFTNLSLSFLREIPIAENPGKELYQMLMKSDPDAEIIESRWSAFGRTDLAGFKNDDNLMGLFIDGAAGTTMYKFNGNFKNPEKHVESLKIGFPGSFPFLFLRRYEKDSMLIIGPGGGREVLLGLLAGVKDITGVEVNRDFVDIVKKYKDYNGGIYTDFRNVNIIVDEGRSFMRGSDEKYDIVMIALPYTKSSRSFEGYALTENYLLTVESIKEYLNHLTDEGRMIVVLHSASETLRFITTSLAAFSEKGIKNQDAMNHIYVIGRGMTPLVILKKKPFTFKEINYRYKVMQQLKFDDLLYFYIPYKKQLTAYSTNQIHHTEQASQKGHKGHDMDSRKMLNESVLFNKTIKELSEGKQLIRLIARTPRDISAARDDKPFFFKRDKGLTDEISLLLRIAILVNILVIVMPAIYMRIRTNIIKPLVLFILLGAGFMLIEISFFQKLTLYLGSPTISLVVLLGSLLAGMGAGSFFGSRFYSNNNIKRVKMISFFIFIVVITLSFIQPLILNALLGSGIIIKSLLCTAFLIPLGFILGIPFPTAISLLKDRGFERVIPWMYGVNGTASVLGSVGAIAISLTFGFSAALILGALCYLAIAVILM